MRNRHVYILAAALTLAGLAIFIYKWLVLGLPLLPGERVSAWDVEVKLSFTAKGGPVKVTTFLPRNTAGTHIFDQRFVAPGYGLSALTINENRQIVLATRNVRGAQVLHMRFVVHRFPERLGPKSDVPPKIVRLGLDGAKLVAAEDLLKTARSQSSDDATLVTALLKLFAAPSSSDSVKMLTGRNPTLGRRTAAAALVLNHGGIPARRVSGIDLMGSGKDVGIVRWVEAYVGNAWTGFAADTGAPELPASYLAWWRGPRNFVALEGADKLQIRLSVVQLEERVLDRILGGHGEVRPALLRFSVFGLPLATQNVYRILLVVPLGILVLVVLRNVVGVRSLGTFMPVLIALAFRETHLIWGIVLFTAIVASGLLFRLYLEQLKLLLVPRLASVLIFVVLFMAFASVVTHQLGFERGLSVSLFPMVIMTMTIERVSVIWDERGASEAIVQAVGSLAIASLCYLIMSHALVEHVFFTFPELLLVLLAGTILLGRYSGYRLLELRRFRVLAGNGP